MTTRNGAAIATVEANITVAVARIRMVGVCRIRGYILARKFPCGYPEGSVRIRLSRRGLGALPARRGAGRGGARRARPQPHRRTPHPVRCVPAAQLLAPRVHRRPPLLLRADR